MEDRPGLYGLDKKERKKKKQMKREEAGKKQFCCQESHMNLPIWSPGAEFDTGDSLPFLIRHHFMI